MTKAKGLYLLAYGLEGALLLLFGAVDGKQRWVVGVSGKVFRTCPHCFGNIGMLDLTRDFIVGLGEQFRLLPFIVSNTKTYFRGKKK